MANKYIDADRLRAFLQKKLESYKSKMVDPSKFPIDHIDLMAFLASEYQALILQIDSLQQEQQEIDFSFEDWEAFRREAAKDAMNGMLSAPQFWQNVWSHNPVNGKCNYPRQIALFAIACADELIKQLKEE